MVIFVLGPDLIAEICDTQIYRYEHKNLKSVLVQMFRIPGAKVTRLFWQFTEARLETELTGVFTVKPRFLTVPGPEAPHD